MRKTLIFFLLLLSISYCYAKERIVSLAPAVTEILYYIGAGEEVVGVTNVCDYPEEAKKVERVGDFTMPVTEKVVALRPSVIIGMDLNDKKMEKFGELGIKYINIKIKRVEDIIEAIKKVGELSGHLKEAQKKSAELSKRIEKIKERASKIKERPKVFILIWDSPLTTAGGETIISQVVESAGGYNIARDLKTEYPLYSREQLVYKRPDLVLGESNLDISKLKIDAKQIKNINIDILYRPGPRIADGIEKLYEIFDNFEKK